MKILSKIFLALFVCFIFAEAKAQPKEVIGITDTVVISGHILQEFVPGLTDIELRKLDNSVSISGVELQDGYYEFDFSAEPSGWQGFYRLYIDNTLKPEWGQIFIGTPLDASGVVPMSGELDMANFRIKNLGSPVSGIDAVSLSYLQANYTTTSSLNTTLTGYMSKTGNNIVSGINTINGQWIFNVGTSLYPRLETYAAPVDNRQFAPKKYVDDKVALINPGEYYQSPNTVRIIYDMLGEDGGSHVWGNLLSGSADAKALATSSSHILITVEGSNDASNVMDGRDENYYGNYLHWKMSGKQMEFNVADQSLTVTAGTASFTEFKFRWRNEESTTTFNGYIFEDCTFDYDGSIAFVNCEFRGTNNFYLAGNGGTSFNNCTGAPVFLNNIPVLSGSARMNFTYIPNLLP